MESIKVAIAGVGNCASSLVQGIHYYREMSADDGIGLMHEKIGGYRAGDIDVVLAYDIDARKVGRDVHEAIFAPPNCTVEFFPDLPRSEVVVRMGKTLDGVAEHMKDYAEGKTFLLAEKPEPDGLEVVQALRDSGVEILLNYLPVGSENATRFYAECALEAGVAFINNIPVFIASDPAWAKRFEEKNIPIIG
ncbi:MAG: inositol-3-phosphate synthase, partial [bacterium]